ncbi:MAG: hypothetical protein MUP68_16085, partial [Deltaproteobacteria bacterium]|nr:hypothetical protein [Deltaproteobacteria bacterium]
LVAGNFHMDVFQVMFAGAADDDLVSSHGQRTFLLGRRFSPISAEKNILKVLFICVYQRPTNF